MPSKPISPDQMERYREQLRELRDRLLGDVDQTAESIREELNPTGDLSHTPIHPADSASGQLDADIHVMDSEWDMLEAVQAALHRIDDQTFGKCITCSKPISAERLRVIPYAAQCVPCANKGPSEQSGVQEPGPRREEADTMRLTGFEAIEFAEREGFTLNKSSDSIDGPAHGLSIAEAEAIASDDPELIWLEIAKDDYTVRKNMRPGR